MAGKLKQNIEHYKNEIMYSKETGTPNNIIFYYAKQDMFDYISLITAYRAKTIKDSNGNPLMDEYVLSPDETDVFLLFMKTATREAYNIVVKMTKGIASQPVFTDENVTIATAITTNLYGFKIVDNAAYNDNILYVVDELIKKYIQYNVLSSWYLLTGVDEELKKWEAKKLLARQDLITKGLFQLRKPLIT